MNKANCISILHTSDCTECIPAVVNQTTTRDSSAQTNLSEHTTTEVRREITLGTQRRRIEGNTVRSNEGSVKSEPTSSDKIESTEQPQGK